jgi:hypothetical protein
MPKRQYAFAGWVGGIFEQISLLLNQKQLGSSVCVCSTLPGWIVFRPIQKEGGQ